MRLRDLNPAWLHGGGAGVGYRPPGTNGEADVPVPPYTAGVEFDCPCGNCGKRRAITFSNPPEAGIPGTPRAGWAHTGTTFDDLTLSPSIWAKRDAARPDNCDWHGFVENGGVRNA